MTAVTLDRRGLLKLLGCGGCALALPSLSGCTIAEVFGGGSALVSFDVAEVPFTGLQSVGGTAALDAAGRNLILIRTEAGTVVALSRICTHTACDLATDRFGTFDGSKLICRCHNSHFAPTGEVLQGPATRDLTSFPVTFDASAGTGTIQIGEGPAPDAAVVDEGVDRGPLNDAGVPEIPREYADLVNPFGNDAFAVESGRTLYQSNGCGACHGMNGEGNALPSNPPPSAFNVDQSAWSDGYLFWRIRTGQASGPVGSIMSAYPNLSDDETWQIVSYLRSLQP